MSDDSNINAPLFDPNQIQDAVEHAPSAGFSPMRFGRVTMQPLVLRWVEENGIRVPKRAPLAPGYALAQGETMELNFIVDIQEFSPALQFQYERGISVRKTQRSGERVVEPTDWSEIVEPSLVKVFGRNWAQRMLLRPYVQVEEVPNVAGKVSKKGKMFGVIKFIHVFPNKETCYAAFKDTVPAGSVTIDNGASADIPANVVRDVAELITSNGEAAVRELLAGKPFGDFDVDELIAAATPH